jgi:hypothetical protein
MTIIQHRRGTAAQWTAANPVLALGELGLETDTLKVKFGTGVAAWASLAYLTAAELSTKANTVHTHTTGDITDMTAVGDSLATATTAAAARAAIGAGTSDLAIGSTGSTAKAGNWFPSFAEVTGTLGTSQLPPLAINEVYTAADQAAMLALSAQRGDIAIRTDNGKTYVLSTDSPGTLADWKQITAVGDVSSVAGRTGAVVLTKTDVGLANVDNTTDAAKPVSTAQATSIATKEPVIAAGTTAQYWRGDKSWQTLNSTAVGLANVDNTSDVNKPVSSATTTQLNLKAPLASPTFTGTVTMPATVNGLTKAMVGLGSVDNTADTAKPVSTAQQTALNGKANTAHTHVAADIISVDGGTP